MVITPDILAYLPNENMNCVQYDSRHSLYPSISSHQWMNPTTTFPQQIVNKEEIRDEPEFNNDSGFGPTPTKDDLFPVSSAGSDKLEGRESSSSNSEGEYYENNDSLKRLQLALQRSGMVTEEKLMCPVCDFSCSVRSQFNEHLVSHEKKCSVCDFQADSPDTLRDHMRNIHERNDEGSNGEEELNTPKVNSQGKVKTFRCKQCEFVAVTKLEFWQHSGTHIKPDRRLTCPKCPFVTEYKHHLDYHLRNHYNSKPFKCTKCSYTCVNKSMLNSHLKSHSNIYQFRCSDCQYATKYCHSLKLHLRKYNHTPAMVLNADGSPNPYPIVDVYGTRRGPKQKQKLDPQSPPQTSKKSPQVFNPYSLLPTQMPYFSILNSFGGFPLQQEINSQEKNNNIQKEDIYEDKAPLDLSISEPMETSSSEGNQDAPIKNRRKGRAFKLERIARRLQQQAEEEEEETEGPVEENIPKETTPIITLPENITAETCKSPVVKSCEADSEQKTEKSDEVKDEYNCSYCDITFKDVVMYTMHMGYHGYQDPFKCNMCGQETTDKLAFFIHIARISHS